ncbi:hypothetical protein FBU59_005333, partial [Linderina macrospora]
IDSNMMAVSSDAIAAAAAQAAAAAAVGVSNPSPTLAQMATTSLQAQMTARSDASTLAENGGQFTYQLHSEPIPMYQADKQPQDTTKYMGSTPSLPHLSSQSTLSSVPSNVPSMAGYAQQPQHQQQQHQQQQSSAFYNSSAPGFIGQQPAGAATKQQWETSLPPLESFVPSASSTPVVASMAMGAPAAVSPLDAQQ